MHPQLFTKIFKIILKNSMTFDNFIFCINFFNYIFMYFSLFILQIKDNLQFEIIILIMIILIEKIIQMEETKYMPI